MSIQLAPTTRGFDVETPEEATSMQWALWAADTTAVLGQGDGPESLGRRVVNSLHPLAKEIGRAIRHQNGNVDLVSPGGLGEETLSPALQAAAAVLGFTSEEVDQMFPPKSYTLTHDSKVFARIGDGDEVQIFPPIKDPSRLGQLVRKLCPVAFLPH